MVAAVNYLRLRLLHFLLVILVLSLAVPHVNSQSNNITETIQQMRRVRVVEDPSIDLPYEVPAEVRPLLTQLKHGLRDLLGETLNSAPTASPSRLRSNLLTRLSASGVRLADRREYKSIEEVPPFTYGGIWDITLHKPKGHRNLVAAVTTLEIGCGTDSSLYLFERRKAGWDLILAVESNGYVEVRNAHGSFEFGVSPPDQNGNWFVVATSITPWCTSNWRSLRYQVLRPGSSAYEPRIQFDASEGIYVGVDEPLHLRVSRNDFSVDHADWFDLDNGLHNRMHLRRFTVKGDKVTRVPPLALAPHDFLDEWTQLAWADAARWVSPGRAALLQEIHKAIKAEDSPWRGIEIAQPCPRMAPKTWVVSLGEQRTLFFTIQQKGAEFWILDVTEQQPAECPGNSSPHH